MKKILILILLFVTSYSVQSQEIKYNSWFGGSIGIVAGGYNPSELDENMPYGVRFGFKNLYFDFRSNFIDRESKQPFDFDLCCSDYEWITSTMGATYRDSSTAISKITIFNLGVYFPLFKTPSTTISLFGGPGLYYKAKDTYDRYVHVSTNTFVGLETNYYTNLNEDEYAFNLNFGIEIAFKRSVSVLVGMDSKSKSLNAGLSIPLTRTQNSNLKYTDKLIQKFLSEDIRLIDDFTPVDMIDFFIRDCKRNGIEINRNQLIKAEFVRDYSVNGADDAIAIAKAMNNDKLIDVEIKDIYWDKSSKVKRWYILYHELGHDVLNLKHGEGGVMMFTYPNKTNYNWESFIKDRLTMFKYYRKKNKTLRNIPKKIEL